MGEPMIKNMLIVTCGLLLSSAASAQEYGALLGVQQTTADISVTGGSGSIDGKLGYKLGLAVDFELMEGSSFRTGLLWNTRKMDVKKTGLTGSAEATYSYFDIPALYQHKITDMISLFGGLIVAFNLSDDISAPASWPDSELDPESLIPLLNVGINLMFDDQIGFDFYYERGLGKIASDDTTEVKDFSTFGANFLYWF